ncbi:MAG TPA: nitrilase-related carbon-nitrogen hydrolase [Candidatus Aminicenantes bacterium]|nr:nitrilase-related carbon-nitrogen hydrolase [Candidatus Aminicenantes bacterium]HRY65227.1 nitrilase-related carbon-nitrogen hydrolase [Candidatus Aminicenantes bacterium]HRZ72305.1 nitrilase-related carbon-nitrogen hydrolase [Candidatus Aminicenantes bacterium]
MRIALVQQSAGPDPAGNRARGRAAFLEAVRNGAGLVAFAELAFTRFYPQAPATAASLGLAEPVPGPTTDLFCSLARETGAVAVLNLFERDGDRTFDSSPVIDAGGRLLGVSRMVHIMDGPGFRERGYYSPGDGLNSVFATAAGRIGVAVCYDRHFPEYMRGLRLAGAEIFVVPQAGTVGEWAEGLIEAELQVASFQNGYYAALVNRVGGEEALEFAGESFVTDPDGQVIARAPRGRDHILYADCDFARNAASAAARHFLGDRRPDVYGAMGLVAGPRKED